VAFIDRLRRFWRRWFQLPLGASDVEKAEEKLGEARLCLDQMIEQERLMRPDQAKFDACRSGFLAAGMTVRNQFPKKAIKAWEAGLTQEQARLWNAMHKERNRDQHRGRSRRRMKAEKIKVAIGTSVSDKSGTGTAMGPPGAGSVTMHKQICYFLIEGTERKATEACAEYLTLLEQMVAALKPTT
jgi:hypothetical protein